MELHEHADPRSWFNVPRDSVKSVIKSVAGLAFKEYGFVRVGYVDIADAVHNEERARTTTTSIHNLGLKALCAGNSNITEISLITVAAGHLLEEPESERAAEMYDALERLPTSHYRVAIFGETDMPIATAQV